MKFLSFIVSFNSENTNLMFLFLFTYFLKIKKLRRKTLKFVLKSIVTS